MTVVVDGADNDMMKLQNLQDMMDEKAAEALIHKGKVYTGQELDGKLYPDQERVIIATYKGPLLGKFKTANPLLAVRHEIKKVQGPGKNSLSGERTAELSWYRGGGRLLVDPRSGRGGQEMVGWGHLGGHENYTFMFMKAILTLRTLCVHYSVEGTKLQKAKEYPTVIVGDKRVKMSQIGYSQCVINLDPLSHEERMVAMVAARTYPSVRSTYEGEVSIYCRISLPPCDVQFVASDEIEFDKRVPTPESWWKATIGLACALGAIDDLVSAFRATRGLAGWLDGIDLLGKEEFSMVSGIFETNGCRSVMLSSNLSACDKVVVPTNLACSLGELVCDWAAGLEMRSMLCHVSDEFGTGNVELNRNVQKVENGSIGDGCMCDARIYNYGPENTFYMEVKERIDGEAPFLGDEGIIKLIQNVGDKMWKYALDRKSENRSTLAYFKNPCFTAYYGSVWGANSTSVIGEDVLINCGTWGGASKSKWPEYILRNWLDLHGLTEEVLVLCGYNAIQRSGLEDITHGSMEKIKGAIGIYSEQGREINWVAEYEPRLGSETLEKDRLSFCQHYLGISNL